jgi:hypothetical protein
VALPTCKSRSDYSCSVFGGGQWPSLLCLGLLFGPVKLASEQSNLRTDDTAQTGPRATAEYNRAVVARFFTSGSSATPEDYAEMPDKLKSAWLKNAPAEIKADYAKLQAAGFVAQPLPQCLSSIDAWVKNPKYDPCVCPSPCGRALRLLQHCGGSAPAQSQLAGFGPSRTSKD